MIEKKRLLLARFLPLLAALLLVSGAPSTLQARTNDLQCAVQTYRNPLLDMDMADPHVIQVDGIYYLYATTHTRGYDVYTSTNLVDWVNKGSVFTDPRGGIWAPDVFRDVHASGKYYLYYTVNTQNPAASGLDKVVGVAEADSPMGPFKDKGVLASTSIDGHLFEDGGKYYLYYVNLDGGFKIMVQPMATPLKKMGEPTRVIYPTEPWEMQHGRVTEGPFMLKHGSTYYLMYSGTGTDSPNYAIGYATASSPMGPFTKYPGNPIAHRTDKIFGPGHHSVIEGPDHKLWLVYHQKWTEGMSFKRFLAIDPIWFDTNGVLRTKLSRDEDRPAPVPGKALTPR